MDSEVFPVGSIPISFLKKSNQCAEQTGREVILFY